MVRSGQADVQARVEVPSSSSVAASRRDYYLRRLKNIPAPPLLEFLREAYEEIVSPPVAEVLVRAVRASTAHQYLSVWKVFCSFVKERDFVRISDTEILSFLSFLFLDRKLSPSTISSYKSALVRPLSLVFGIDLTRSIYVDFTKAIGNLRPVRPSAPIRWSLD